MSMALLFRFIAAFPINWWLVSIQLKHGMITFRPVSSSGIEAKQVESSGKSMKNMENMPGKVSPKAILSMIILFFVVLFLGFFIALSYQA